MLRGRVSEVHKSPFFIEGDDAMWIVESYDKSLGAGSWSAARLLWTKG